MRRNLLLIFAFLVSVLLVVNGAKRLMSFQTTSREIEDAQRRLEKVQKENEQLKADLDYKKSREFTEEEIRNKLGLTKNNEAIVIVPNENSQQIEASGKEKTSNWQKWWNLFFGG